MEYFNVDPVLHIARLQIPGIAEVTENYSLQPLSSEPSKKDRVGVVGAKSHLALKLIG